MVGSESARISVASGDARRALVVGAGYAGLTAALGLLRQGWTVRVFERARSARSEGYSIAFHENGLRTLEALGLLARALEHARPMPSRQTRDRLGRITSDFDADYRVYRISRPHLVGVLAEEATRLGAEIVFEAPVREARPDGRIVLSDGTEATGDLVVAADGVNSPIRDSLGLLRRRAVTGEGAIRVLSPRTPGELGPEDDGVTGFEFWSGRRRFLYRVANAESAYLTFTCREKDERGRRAPLDVASWAGSFPTVAPVIEKAAREADWREARWAPFVVITLKRWSAGRVAVVGDAAHAMAPNLAQGGNTAMMNALALSAHVSEAETVEAGLAAWERSERPIVEHAQRWSSRFTAPQAWPEWLWTFAVPRLARTRWVREGMTRPARYAPKGAPPAAS